MGFGKVNQRTIKRFCKKKDDNNEMERPQPVHTVMWPPDTLTEKLHEGL